jgi:hypothetical protein
MLFMQGSAHEFAVIFAQAVIVRHSDSSMLLSARCHRTMMVTFEDQCHHGGLDPGHSGRLGYLDTGIL